MGIMCQVSTVIFTNNKSDCFQLLKGWLTGFFLGLIVFMGCSLACVHACFFLKRIIFHIIYLYSTPLCPFSDKRLDLFPGLWSPSLDGLRLVSWLSVLWLAKPPLQQRLNVPPLSSAMRSGWIVNSGVVYNAYQFEPDWDPEDISEEDRAEPVQAQLLMLCLVVVVSYF